MDPDFVEVLAAFPPLQFADPAPQRAALAAMHAQLPVPPWPAGLKRVDRLVAGAGGHRVPVRVYVPDDIAPDAGVLLWMHGGGYCIGTPEEDEPLCARLALGASAVVVSVDYRLAPEHPYPAGLDDCYAALLHVAGDGYPSGPVVVGGGSAGAGLAAAVALRARDEAGPAVRGQLLLFPFLDSRLGSVSMGTHADAPVFDAEDARHCWVHYLGNAHSDPPHYGSPSAATDLAGLPSAYVVAAGADCLRDEAVDYALRLQAAGVATELHVVPGVPHGFTGLLPTAPASRRVRAELAHALSRFLEDR